VDRCVRDRDCGPCGRYRVPGQHRPRDDHHRRPLTDDGDRCAPRDGGRRDPGRLVITVYDPSGAITGIGAPGVPIAAGGIAFTLTPGTTPLAVGDAFVINVAPAPLDLTGIAFDLMIRTTAADPAVALWATTRTVDGAVGRIVSGGAGGQVALDVSEAVMARLRPGTYAYDIVATADGRRVLVAYGTIEHVRGVTNPII